MFNSKKAIGPVIASALFLVVAVVSVISFQTWFEEYGSDIFTNVETRSTESVSNTKIEAILGTTLYFKNGFNSNLSITDVKVDGNSCSVTTNVSSGMIEITLGNNCTNNLTTTTPEVVVYTKSGIYSAYVWYKNATITTQTLSEVLSSPSSFVWYNYNISNSLRFDGSTSYLSRTPSVVGNRTTWTWSGWVKRGNLGSAQSILFSARSSVSIQGFISLNSDQLIVNQRIGGLDKNFISNKLFRDPSQWEHVLVIWDSTNPTANDRIQVYENGVKLAGTITAPDLNSLGNINDIIEHNLGREANIGSSFYDGYLSEVNFIDGQALNASYFGEFNDAGKWTPKKYTGTYGTNGFYLPFNNTNILGEDNSPIENNITEDFSQGGIKIESDRWQGDTLFLDSSGNKHPITAYGNTIHSTTTKMFGDTSIYFDGNGDYLQIANNSDWQFGSEDFTIDFWVKNIASNTFMLGSQTQWNNPYDGWNVNLAPISNSVAFYAQNAGTSQYRWVQQPTTVLNDGNWHHLAIVRNGSVMRFYVDGVSTTSEVAVDLRNYTAPNGLILGIRPDGSNIEPLNGYIDKFRITKGKALWTSNFTPEKAPNDWTATNLDETGGLLIHSNVTSNYTSIQFQDESGNGHTINVNGNPQHSLKTSAVNDNSAIYFDGSSSFLELPIQTDLYFNSSDNYTLDFWAKYVSGEGGINIGNYQDSVCQGLLSIQINTGEFNLNPNGPTCGYTYNIINGADATGEWMHYAYVKNGYNYSLYINGVSQGSFTFSGALNVPNLIWIGKRTMGAGNAQYWTGYMDEIRISKEARWTGNFTPPTSRYTTDSYTKLLIHSDYNEILDSGDHKHKITPVGDAKHSTSQSKFGTSSLYFDGTGDYLAIPDSNDFDVSNQDFTIDFWVYNIGGGEIISQRAPGVVDWLTINIQGGTAGYFYSDSGANTWDVAIAKGFGTIPTNTWTHMAVTRLGNTFNLYKNGVVVNTFTSTGSILGGTTDLYIGKDNTGFGGNFNGYLDEIRITKGKALWTTNFTPDTSPATRIDSYSTDIMIDTPTNNFATINVLNPAVNFAGCSISDGNLEFTQSGVLANQQYITIFTPKSGGKYYFEALAKIISNQDQYTYVGHSGNGSYYRADGFDGNGNVLGSTFTSGDMISLTYDSDSNVVEYFKNGVSQGTGSFNTESVVILNGYSNSIWNLNFGQGGQSGVQWCENASGYFKYCPPSGFKALSTSNLPSPAINISKQFFDVINYTGNGGTQNITGLNFTPDLTWIKSRSLGPAGAYTGDHRLYDSYRGINNYLTPNENFANATTANTFTGFLTNGFTLGNNMNSINYNTHNFVAWNWKESQTAGIDIINYTGDGTAALAVSHNLNTTPDLIIIKTLNFTDSWYVYSKSLGASAYLNLDNSNFAVTSSPHPWNATNPTSNSFSVSSSGNRAGIGYIAYAFAEKEGFSKFGKYTGNGLAEGPFIYTGFKPKYIMIKRTDSTGDWWIFDTERESYNPINQPLFANLPNADTASGWDIDFLSNGFKFRYTHSVFNANGATYIYMTFAQYPFR